MRCSKCNHVFSAGPGGALVSSPAGASPPATAASLVPQPSNPGPSPGVAHSSTIPPMFGAPRPDPPAAPPGGIGASAPPRPGDPFSPFGGLSASMPPRPTDPFAPRAPSRPPTASPFGAAADPFSGLAWPSMPTGPVNPFAAVSSPPPSAFTQHPAPPPNDPFSALGAPLTVAAGPSPAPRGSPDVFPSTMPPGFANPFAPRSPSMPPTAGFDPFGLGTATSTPLSTSLSRPIPATPFAMSPPTTGEFDPFATASPPRLQIRSRPWSLQAQLLLASPLAPRRWQQHPLLTLCPMTLLLRGEPKVPPIPSPTNWTSTAPCQRELGHRRRFQSTTPSPKMSVRRLMPMPARNSLASRCRRRRCRRRRRSSLLHPAWLVLGPSRRVSRPRRPRPCP